MESGFKRKLSILWIHQNFVIPRQSGNSRPLHIVSAFYSREWKTRIITGKTGYLGEVTGVHREPIIRLDPLLEITGLADPSGFSFLKNRKMAYLIFFIRSHFKLLRIKRMDIVYCSSPPLPQVIISMIASVIHNSPFVLELRDIWPLYLKECGILRSKLLIFMFEWLESATYHFADCCIAVSPPYLPYLVEMGVSENNIVVVPTGSDPAIRKQNGTAWRKKADMEPYKLIVYSGSFNEAYNLDILLECANRTAISLPNVKWLIAGNGRQLNKIIRASKSQSNVIYLGNLAKDDLMPVLAAADIGIITHASADVLKTALSGKVFDYLAAELKIISLTDGITGELVKSAKGGMVLSNPSVTDLEAAIQQIFSQPPDEIRKEVQNSANWIFKHINAIEMGNRVADVVEQQLHKKGSFYRWIRLGKSIGKGLADAISGKSRKASKKYYGTSLDTTIKESWLNWLLNNQAQHGEKNSKHIVPVQLTRHSEIESHLKK